MAERSGLLGGVAKVLNAGGGAVVTAYDFSSDALENVFKTIRNTAVRLPEEVKHVVEGGIKTVVPGEKSKLEGKIKDFEKKIQGLYLEIGKESAKFTDKGMALGSETVKRLLAEVRGHMFEIDTIKGRIAELDAESSVREVKRREKPRPAADDAVLRVLKATINEELFSGNFKNTLEKVSFERITRGIAGKDHELQLLGVRELGNMKTGAAVKVLAETAVYMDPDLAAASLNALVSIGDTSVLSLFENKTRDENHMVREAALHGLYRLSPSAALPFLTEALRDINANVRVLAATILGWMGATDAVSALCGVLEDRESRVRKAAIMALTDIGDKTAIRPLIRMLGDDDAETRGSALESVRLLTGIQVVIDVHASGKSLSRAVEALQDWWWNKTVVGIDAPAPWEAATEAGCEPGPEVAPSVEAQPETIASGQVSGGADEVGRVAEEAAAPGASQVEAVAEEAAATDAADDEGAAIAIDDARQARYEELKGLRKYELLKLCSDQGIDCDLTLTKTEIINLLLDRFAA